MAITNICLHHYTNNLNTKIKFYFKEVFKNRLFIFIEENSRKYKLNITLYILVLQIIFMYTSSFNFKIPFDAFYTIFNEPIVYLYFGLWLLLNEDINRGSLLSSGFQYNIFKFLKNICLISARISVFTKQPWFLPFISFPPFLPFFYIRYHSGYNINIFFLFFSKEKREDRKEGGREGRGEKKREISSLYVGIKGDLNIEFLLFVL